MRIYCNVCAKQILDKVAIRDVHGYICIQCGKDLDENGNFPEEVEGDMDDRYKRTKTRSESNI